MWRTRTSYQKTIKTIEIDKLNYRKENKKCSPNFSALAYGKSMLSNLINPKSRFI